MTSTRSPDDAQRLRDEATALLRAATACEDPQQRDLMVGQALRLLDQVRLLREQAGSVGHPPETRH